MSVLTWSPVSPGPEPFFSYGLMSSNEYLSTALTIRNSPESYQDDSNIDPRLLGWEGDRENKHAAVRRTTGDLRSSNAESTSPIGPTSSAQIGERSSPERKAKRLSKLTTQTTKTPTTRRRRQSTSSSMLSPRTPGPAANAVLSNNAAFPFGSTAESAETASYCRWGYAVVLPKTQY